MLPLIFLLTAIVNFGWGDSTNEFCRKCQDEADAAAFAVRLGFYSMDEVILEAESICREDLNLGSLCKPAVNIIVPYLFPLVMNTTFTGQQLCSILLPPCSEIFQLQTKKWTVQLPPKPIALPRREQVPGRQLRVLQLTDIHVDEEYAPGSDSNCAPAGSIDFVTDILLCCRGGTTKNLTETAGHWGNTMGQCDLPYRTFESALRFISSRKMTFDYILLTGDFQPHDFWQYTQSRSAYYMSNVTASIERYLPGVPIFLTPGNHEAVPFDAYSYQAENQTRPQEWLYQLMQQMIARWSKPDERKQLLIHGSYVSFPAPGLKVINLNNNFCYVYNFYAHLNPDDPGHVLAFLVAELTSAEANGQRVHIHAHVPPTSIDCFPEWTKNYQLILERFRETIAEQFFGHNHVEKNLVWLDSTSQQPMATGWVAPSLTTWSHVNPAFRVYTIESTNFNVISSSVFHTSVDDLRPSDEPHWLEINTGLLYQLPSFSATSWNSFFDRLQRNSTARQDYVAALYRNSPWFQAGNCDDDCILSLVHENYVR